MRRVEFWPDHGAVLLHADGQPLALAELGLEDELVDAAQAWVAEYDDGKLNSANRDEEWIEAGRRLFERLREALRSQAIELYDWEGYWAVSPRR